jgi:nucleotide-binding universal stress UspA family protein
MFKRILYPTDFSDVSKKALDYIKQLKEGGSETVIVLHVIDHKGIEAIEQYAPGDSVELIQKINEEAEYELKAIEDELTKCGIQVITKIVTGIPLREILKTEEEEDISVIVIGSHGKSNVKEIFLGSVSEKVARKSKKPVLIIKR